MHFEQYLFILYAMIKRLTIGLGLRHGEERNTARSAARRERHHSMATKTTRRQCGIF